jgi:hypothetical protein
MMAGLIYLIVVIGLFLFVVIDFAVRAWRMPASRWSTPDRAGLMVGFAAVVATFVLFRALIDSPVIDTIVWLVATVITAAGVVGAVITWGDRPWLRERRPRRRITALALGGVAAGALVWLFA